VSQIQHAIILSYRSSHEDHNIIYFTIFGAILFKIWILEALKEFLEINFKILLNSTGQKCYAHPAPSPRIHTEEPTGGPSGQRDPTCHPHKRRGAVLNGSLSPAVTSPAIAATPRRPPRRAAPNGAWNPSSIGLESRWPWQWRTAAWARWCTSRLRPWPVKLS
jgi:hypothetical protein